MRNFYYIAKFILDSDMFRDMEMFYAFPKADEAIIQSQAFTSNKECVDKCMSLIKSVIAEINAKSKNKYSIVWETNPDYDHDGVFANKNDTWVDNELIKFFIIDPIVDVIDKNGEKAEIGSNFMATIYLDEQPISKSIH